MHHRTCITGGRLTSREGCVIVCLRCLLQLQEYIVNMSAGLFMWVSLPTVAAFGYIPSIIQGGCSALQQWHGRASSGAQQQKHRGAKIQPEPHFTQAGRHRTSTTVPAQAPGNAHQRSAGWVITGSASSVGSMSATVPAAAPAGPGHIIPITTILIRHLLVLCVFITGVSAGQYAACCRAAVVQPGAS